jgi:hypothetical protein
MPGELTFFFLASVFALVVEIRTKLGPFDPNDPARAARVSMGWAAIIGGSMGVLTCLSRVFRSWQH